MPEYIAMNLNDFHSNQSGNAETTVQLVFVGAKDRNAAGNMMKQLKPAVAWSIFPKSTVDKFVVCADPKDALKDVVEATKLVDTNPPLTLEELRVMDGEPVWIEATQQWRIVDVDHENEFVRLYTVFNTISAKSALNDDGRIYRRKPEEVCQL